MKIEERGTCYTCFLIAPGTDLTAPDVVDGGEQQRSGLRHKLTLLHPGEVIHGEEVRLLHQVSWKPLQLSRHPETEKPCDTQ